MDEGSCRFCLGEKSGLECGEVGGEYDDKTRMDERDRGNEVDID